MWELTENEWGRTALLRAVGGGIIKGSLGSMLPYIVRAKEDKLGIVLFDDLFKDSIRGGEIDVRVWL